MSKVPSAKPVKVHRGWLQPAPRPPDQQPVERVATTTTVAATSGTLDFFIPVTDALLISLVETLRRDDGLATEITLAASRATAPGVWLARLCGSEGWLMVGMHTLRSADISSEHYVLSASCETVATVHPEACRQLLSCQMTVGEATPIPDDVRRRLQHGLERLSPKAAKERHRRRLEEVRDKMRELNRRLDKLDEEIAETRRALRRFVRRNNEYMELGARLTNLLQEDFSVVVQRRKLRAGKHLGAADLDILMHDVEEATRPLLVLRWRLEP